MTDVRRTLLCPAHGPARVPGRRRTTALVVGLVVAVLVPLAGAAAPAQARVPSVPHRYTAAIEGLASYVGQSTCSPAPKKGTVAFANLLLRTYPNSRSLGISRACKVGGKSEHKEGRAFDWGVSVKSARDRASVHALFGWLFKTDRHGNRYAMARRLGIQYIIWNRRIWGAYAANRGWRKYTGSNPHTDHVHFSLSWTGARKQTSFWHPKDFPRGGTPPPPRPSGPESSKPAPAPAPRPQGDDSRPTRPANPEPRAPRSLAQAAPLVTERVAVPARRRSGARPDRALVAGHRYLVEASGSYRFARRAGSVADAECSRLGSTWYRSRSLRRDDPRADHLDLYIDGHDLYAESDNGRSCDLASHTYRWVYTAARSGRAPLAVWDPNGYADNSGSLNVRLVDLDAPRESATWTVPAKAAAGATGPAFRGGVAYDVTVTGTWRDGSGLTADAECTLAYGRWQRDRWGDGDFDVLLADFGYRLVPTLEGVRMEPATDTGDRCDAQAHRYTFVWTPGHDQPLSLRVADPNGRRGNSGSLRVQVRPHSGAPTTDPTPGPTPGPAPEPLRTEQVRVDSRSGAPQRTAQEFPAGTTVRLTVSGKYLMRKVDSWEGDWIAADAECTVTADDRTWRSQRFTGWFNGARQPLGDLAVDGRILTWSPSDRDGECDERDNTYTLDYKVPATGRIALVIADDDRSDNAGELTVTVAPQ